MALIPQPQSQTVEAIYAWWANKLQRRPRRLGASQIGNPCERALWYAFRWCVPSSPPDGRMQRLFNRGHREEQVFVDELRGIGCTVYDIDPATGQQFEFTACGGHFVAKIDGVALGVPEAPKTWHVLSFKTINAKGFAELARDGVAKAKPEHVAQNQAEMHLSQLTRTLYLNACKDDDRIHGERIRYDEAQGAALMAKAERVIFGAEPGDGLSTDPAFYKCKQCPAAQVCHTAMLPPVSCRTCLHATPERDGDGRWSCARWRDEQGRPSTIPFDAQADACDEHRYIPALLRRWGEAVDASEAEGWVEYRADDGFVFRNGPWGERSYTSRELAAASPALLRNSEFMAIRARYAGQIVEREAFPGDEMKEAA